MAKKFKIKGLRDFERKLRVMPDKAKKGIASALMAEGEIIMTKSKQIVPVDTGALRSTGHVQKPKMEERRVEVRLGYGGSAGSFGKVGYAVWVHENMNAFHKSPTQAKYLEQPMMEARQGYSERLKTRLKNFARTLV